MQQIARLFLRKYSAPEIEALVKPVLTMILADTRPCKVLLFGSATRGDFDACSDLDFVVIYASAEEAAAARPKLYRQRPLSEHPVDFLCIDNKMFDEKANCGGVYFNAALDGKVLYSG